MYTVEQIKRELEEELQPIINNLKKQVRFRNASEQEIIARAKQMLLKKYLKGIK